jgi:hypothetical protein
VEIVGVATYVIRFARYFRAHEPIDDHGAVCGRAVEGRMMCTTAAIHPVSSHAFRRRLIALLKLSLSPRPDTVLSQPHSYRISHG